MFLFTVLGIWGVLHAYVFWRLATLLWLRRRRSRLVFAVLGVLGWASFPAGRFLLSGLPDGWGIFFEYLLMAWVGTLFLLFSFLLMADVVTLGGWLFPRFARRLRSVMVMFALVAAVIALVQGARLPEVRDCEIHLPGLPSEADGYTFVAISDLHLGTLIGEDWLAAVVERINALEPQAVLISGDLIDGNVDHVGPMQAAMRRLEARDGIWGVTGNHEYYAGLERSVEWMEAAGIEVLRERAVELVPGLYLAGVDDPAVRTERGHAARIEAAMGGVPAGAATVLLSHTPVRLSEAAEAGADLMFSGHTHGGQIWPFNWIVRLQFPYVYGLHQLEGMQLLVSRGAGTWGPRMRLWARGEILRVRLRSGEGS